MMISSLKIRDVIESVQERLRGMQAVQGMKVLEQEEKDLLIEREKMAEEQSVKMGFVKVVNEGFWTTFLRDHQIALVLKPGLEVKPRVNELLQLRDKDEKKIGEWIGGKNAVQRAGVSEFGLSDFVLYEGAKPEGELHFVVPEIEFPFLEGVKGVQKVVSCSPASGVDDLIREWLSLKEEGLYTRIIGFDIDRDSLY